MKEWEAEMAVNPQQELIWQGRLQHGDEPGVYGDATYCGLASELPITVQRLDPANRVETQFRLVLDSEGLQTFAGFPGHEIVVVVYEPDPLNPQRFIERVLAQDRFRGADNNRKEVVVTVALQPGPFRMSVRVRCDTTVVPGLYDDFVWLRLSLVAQDHAFFAALGFSS